jgi:hypothetical protein
LVSETEPDVSVDVSDWLYRLTGRKCTYILSPKCLFLLAKVHRIIEACSNDWINTLYNFITMTKIINTFGFFLFITAGQIAYGQNTNEIAFSKGLEVIKQMDDRKLEAHINSLQTNLDKEEKARSDKRYEIEEQIDIDSLYLDKFLTNAMKIAEQYKEVNRFNEEYVETMPDSSYQVEVSISSDFYFTNKYPHLVIRRNTPNTIYIDVFSKKDNQFQKVVSHELWSLTYVSDTIRDINGDGLKDFVVNWYGSNGCCLKAFSDVYILRADKKTFSDMVEFINPTFSPKEKIIRGVCYGHPGETEMYKYKWNGESVDTLEYISYEINKKGQKTGKIIVTTEPPFSDHFKVMKRLNSIPSEYKQINGYDWFTGN